MTVKEVSQITGISIRTLHYYDEIGLLKPSDVTESGYRIYDDEAIERIEQILFFKELEFSLGEIKEILDSKNYDKTRILEEQIELLKQKRKHLDNLINLATGISSMGISKIDFKVYDTNKIDQYAEEAEKKWGDSKEYKEFEKKNKNYGQHEKKAIEDGLMNKFVEFSKLLELSEESNIVQAKVEGLQNYITQNFYECTDEILEYLGKMYADDGRFTENIDNASKMGTASFVSRAIAYYIENKK